MTKITITSLSLASLLILSGCSLKLDKTEAKVIGEEILNYYLEGEPGKYQIRHGVIQVEGSMEEYTEFEKGEFRVDLDDSYYCMTNLSEDNLEYLETYYTHVGELEYCVDTFRGGELNHKSNVTKEEHGTASKEIYGRYRLLLDLPYIALSYSIGVDYSYQEEGITIEMNEDNMDLSTVQYHSKRHGNLTIKFMNTKGDGENPVDDCTITFDKYYPVSILGHYKNGEDISIKYDFSGEFERYNEPYLQEIESATR